MSGARDYNPPPPFFSSPSPFKHQIQESAAAKAYDIEWKWLNSSEAKQRGAAAKALAFSDFQKRFPHAQMAKFQVQVEFDANRKALGRVLFPDGDGSWENPLIEDQKYWSPALKAALGAQQDGGFPVQLSLLPTQSQAPNPVPAIAFSDNRGQRIADLFNKQVKIYVTPTDYFTTKFRQIFTKTQIKLTQAKYARKWLAKPDMSFWPQQLNFALWCATTGCGVSREMLFSNSSLQLTTKSEPSTSFTCTTPRERSCTRWVVFKARTRCQTTPRSIRKTTRMTSRPISVSVLSLVLTRARTFVSPMGRTTGWGT